MNGVVGSKFDDEDDDRDETLLDQPPPKHLPQP